MSKPLHTPGPFEAKPATASIPTMHIHTSRGVIASVHGARHVRDAQLFAAGPELLEVAEQMLAQCQPGTGHSMPDVLVGSALAAVAKAKGRIA